MNINYYPKSGESSLSIAIDGGLLFSHYLFKSEVNKPYYTHCQEMFKYIQKYITLKEECNFNDNLINKICKFARGDLRKAINLLQNCDNAFSNEENERLLDEFSGIISKETFDLLFKYIFDKDLNNINKIIEEIYIQNYSLVNQITYFHNFIFQSNLNDEQKIKIINKISDIDQNLIKGCDEYIQLMRLIYYIVSII